MEREIAARLRRAGLEERKRIYAGMYQELFGRVPDHPRLTRRESALLTAAANRAKLSLVAGFLERSSVFVAEVVPFLGCGGLERRPDRSGEVSAFISCAT